MLIGEPIRHKINKHLTKEIYWYIDDELFIPSNIKDKTNMFYIDCEQLITTCDMSGQILLTLITELK